jgi:proteasome accessory factor B
MKGNARNTNHPALKFRRVAWERIIHIDAMLRDGKYPNSVGLARELGVSLRTIRRDIEFMKERQCLPIEYDEARWGFFYSKPVDGLLKTPMSEAEIFSVLIAHKAVAQYHGTPYEKPLRMAFEKLTGQLDSHERYSLENLGDALSFRPFAPADTDLKTFEVLTRGLQERRGLRFQYRNWGERTARTRRSHPYHLACIDNHWYLFAHDIDRNAMRTFVLSRLSCPELTSERFTRPPNFSPDKYLRGSLNVMKGADDYEVVIQFDTFGTDLIRGRTWHQSQELTLLPGGGSQLRLRLSGLDEIERSVLNWGRHATIIRPRALAERVRKTAEDLAMRYEGLLGEPCSIECNLTTPLNQSCKLSR